MFRFLYRKDNNYGKVEAISQCGKTFLETTNFHTVYAPKMLAIITDIIDLFTKNSTCCSRHWKDTFIDNLGIFKW